MTSSMTPMKWFWGFLKKYCPLLVLGLLMTTVIAVLAIVNPYVSGLIVDDVIRKGQIQLLPRLIGILLSVTLVRSVLRFFYQVIFEKCSQGVLYDMRDKVYRRQAIWMPYGILWHILFMLSMRMSCFLRLPCV